MSSNAIPNTTSGSKVTQPEWQVPAKSEEEPVLKVYNSLTRTKTEFVPRKGRQVTWYNCGPTVYDASHMGHARNYVTQDIIRRILRDYFGYDIHLVMNVTDIDDKIILRARQSHLFSTFNTTYASSPSSPLTPTLISTLRSAWSFHFVQTLSKSPSVIELLGPLEEEIQTSVLNPTVEGDGKSEDWEKLERRWEELKKKRETDGGEEWVRKATEKDQKFGMYWTALANSRSSIVAAEAALRTGQTDQEGLAQKVTKDSQDVLSGYLDKLHGSTVTSPSVFRSLASYWERSFFDDMSKLHVLPPETLTRVSEYVPEIVSFVERVIERGIGYEDGKGNVWFSTGEFDGKKKEDGEWNHVYAKLQPWSKGNKELLDEGEGSLTASTGKRFPSDFALWKTSKPGEPMWDSPWGKGRPGWHIECSVMASEVLGSGMDIHSGGVDLMFPHHDNEIAQSEAYHDCRQWVNYFLHTGHLHIEGLKMSKSLKNFITIQEALDMHSARQLRLAFMQQLWSSKLDFKESLMAEVRSTELAFNNFFNMVKAIRRKVQARVEASDGQHHYGTPETELTSELHRSQTSFRIALCDSFNTPDALDVLVNLVSKANIYISERNDPNLGVLETVAIWVTRMLRMFGLGEGPAREGEVGWGEVVKSGEENVDREALVMPFLNALSSFRDEVRKLALEKAPHQELLSLADRLRNEELIELGVQLDDQSDGKALVKLVPAEELIKAREATRAAAAEKAAKRAAQAAAAEAKKQEKLAKGKLSPAEMFKPPHCQEGYQSFDEQGLPTLDSKGEELGKNAKKKLAKQQEAQAKLHEEYLKSLQG